MYKLLHELWGKAKESPNYNKQEWKQLQSYMEVAEAALKRILAHECDDMPCIQCGTDAREALHKMECYPL